MNLREQLLAEHSRSNADTIAAWAGTDARRVKELMQLFLGDEYRVVQRAARVLSLIAETQPHLIRPHLDAMVDKMQLPGQPGAVRRNVVRLLQDMEIPEHLQGPVMNACFDMLADPKEAVAIRVFSMTVLARLARVYPELKQELVAVIEDGLEHEPTPAFRSRGLRTLRELKQEGTRKRAQKP